VERCTCALLLPLRLSTQFHQQGIHQGGGQEVSDPKLNKLYKIKFRKKVGMVFRQYNLFPHKTAIQSLMMAPIHVLKHKKTEIKERARALIKKLRLKGKENN
jgi:polar amino acid transport system ATP-binding protein